MKVLIVSYLFAPNNEIGAIRPTKIAKYLKDNDAIVDVISYGYKENNTLEIPNSIRNHIMFSQKDGVFFQTQRKQTSRKIKLPIWIKKIYRFILDFKKAQKFKKFCVKTFCNSKEQYDCLLTSYGPISSILCGLEIKKICPKIKWICDFRDPIITEETPSLFSWYLKKLQNKACQKADYITAVSQGYLERICGEKYANKKYIIYNGFDTQDLKKNCIMKTEKLRMTYAGSLYEGKRDLSPLFQAINFLRSNNLVLDKNIEFHYAGSDFDFLKNQASKYNLENILMNHGRLSREDCLKMELNSDILILSTWNKKRETGVLPGKFFEYLLFDKPILSIVNGNLKNSEISNIIKNTNTGFSFETADGDRQFKEFVEFILKEYNKIINCEKNDFKPNKNVIENFTYQNITKHFYKLMVSNKGDIYD